LAVRPDAISAGQEERSFIETARRAQIVECAIQAIGELGYSNASLADIARRARVSKGVIHYYFADKADLIKEVFNAVMEKAVAVMLPRMLVERSASGMLRAYIESNLEFLGSHLDYVRALIDIAVSARTADGKPVIDLARTLDPVVHQLELLLRHGQERGEFRDFSTRVMAVAIRNAIDGVPPLLAADPKLDLKLYTNELATLFDLATRKSPSEQR
jgi:TetR/AcrR family transcriptional regulator, fatty acid metabolism regulator protein